MFICSSSCPAAADPTPYHDPCAAVRRRSGQGGLALVKCDKEWTDVRDPAEWTTAIGAGDVIPLKQKGSKWTLPPPNITFEEDGQGNKFEVEREYLIPWETFNVKKDSSDDLFFKKLEAAQSQWTVVPMTADGESLVTDAFFDDLTSGSPIGSTATGAAAGYTIGHYISFDVAPHKVFGDSTTTFVRWAFTLSIKRQGIMGGVWLAGVPAVVIE